MHKKSLALVLLLLCLMAAALWGLPSMTGQMQKARTEKSVYVTASPEPAPDEYGAYEG